MIKDDICYALFDKLYDFCSTSAWPLYDFCTTNVWPLYEFVRTSDHISLHPYDFFKTRSLFYQRTTSVRPLYDDFILPQLWSRPHKFPPFHHSTVYSQTINQLRLLLSFLLLLLFSFFYYNHYYKYYFQFNTKKKYF